MSEIDHRQQRSGVVMGLDILDGFQVSKGLFSASLVLSWLLGIGGNATREVRRLVDGLSGGDAAVWLVALAVYSAACFLCLVWKHRLFQFVVSVISVFIWIWMGFVTLWAPGYAAAAGLYEVMLGLGSIVVLYFRGRQL